MTAKATLKLGRCILAEKPKRYRADWKPSRPLMRRAEVEKVIRDRHGGMIPDPEDTDDRETCLDYIKAAAFSLSGQDMPNWCSKWAPWAREDEINDIVSQASRRRRMMTADGVAGLIRVTMADRTRLSLKTIGACDLSKSERTKLAKDRKRERDRSRREKQRRAKGSKDRQSYEAQSLSATKPWEAAGICRRTWERRRGVAGPSQVLLRKQNGDALATSDVQTPPTSPRVHCKRAACEARGAQGLGDIPPAELHEAAPHGTSERRSEEAA